MARRRMTRMSEPGSPASMRRRMRRARSMSGMTRWFEIMIDSATQATITIAVAADRPPIITNTASVVAPDSSGSASTVMSRSITPSGKVRRPAMASGMTKMLMATRYSGNSHAAVRTSRSSRFSTTVTWNWRGSSRMLHADRSVVATHVDAFGMRASTLLIEGSAAAREVRSPRPSNIHHVT